MFLKLKSLLFVFVLFISTQLMAQDGGLKILKTIKLADDNRWDFLTVDAKNQRLFLSHQTKVLVIDIKTEKLITEIDNTAGVHGIALAPELNKGFISCGESASVVMFDLTSYSVIKRIPVTGKDPDGILYEPTTQRVFTFNGDGGNSTVIDAKTGAVLATIDLKGSPEFAVTDGKGYIYDNLEKESMLLKINASTYKIEARWPLSPCEGPTGLAIDIVNNRLFTGCRGNKGLSVVDANTGKVITTLPIGDKVDAVCFDPSTGNVFASNGDGTVNVFHQDSPDSYSIVQTITTKPRSKTMALDTNSHLLYVPCADMTPDKKVMPGTSGIFVIGK